MFGGSGGPGGSGGHRPTQTHRERRRSGGHGASLPGRVQFGSPAPLLSGCRLRGCRVWRQNSVPIRSPPPPSRGHHFYLITGNDMKRRRELRVIKDNRHDAGPVRSGPVQEPRRTQTRWTQPGPAGETLQNFNFTSELQETRSSPKTGPTRPRSSSRDRVQFISQNWTFTPKDCRFRTGSDDPVQVGPVFWVLI